jgi:hypothetical protein
MDLVFLLDMVYKTFQAVVHDLGFKDSTVDRLVNSAPTITATGSQANSETKEDVRLSGMGDKRLRNAIPFGQAVRWHLLVECPVRIALMSLEWIVLLKIRFGIPPQKAM